MTAPNSVLSKRPYIYDSRDIFKTESPVKINPSWPLSQSDEHGEPSTFGYTVTAGDKAYTSRSGNSSIKGTHAVLTGPQ